jgi:dienelactone hydrolase
LAWGFIPFIWQNRWSRSYPIVRGFLEQLRKEEPDAKVGGAGFCWGGKLLVLLAQGAAIDGKTLMDAAFTGHPSLLTIPTDVEKITVPTSFAVGDLDTQISVPQAEQIRQIVEAFPEGSKGEMKLYPGCNHGFCVRADVTAQDSAIAKQALEAEDQCMAWFDKHFGAGK